MNISHDINLLVIEKVKPYECIYNKNHEHHRQTEYRELIWNTIAKELNLKVDVVKNRWKSVRDNYRKNINKKLKNPKNHKPYRYAEEIKFLDKYFMFPESNHSQTSYQDEEVSTDLSSNCEFQDETSNNITSAFDVEDFEDNEEVHEFFKASPKVNDFVDNMEFININALNEDNVTDQQINSDIINSPSNAEVCEEEDLIDLESNEEDCAVAAEVNEDFNTENTDSIAQEKCTNYNFIRKLIAEVQKYECIYNINYKHEDSQYKEYLWQRIGKKLGTNARVAKLKWKHTRDAYKNYKQRLLQDNGFVKPYKYAKYLKFLDQYAMEKGTRPFIKYIPQTDRTDVTNNSDIEVSTDLSSDDENDNQTNFNQNNTHTKTKNINQINCNQNNTKKSEFQNIDSSDDFNPKAITRRLFILLANKINEANLSAQQRNDIEFMVSSIVYKKLEEHHRNN